MPTITRPTTSVTYRGQTYTYSGSYGQPAATPSPPASTALTAPLNVQQPLPPAPTATQVQALTSVTSTATVTTTPFRSGVAAPAIATGGIGGILATGSRFATAGRTAVVAAGTVALSPTALIFIAGVGLLTLSAYLAYRNQQQIRATSQGAYLAPAPIPPPFTGGQCQIEYDVSVTVIFQDMVSNDLFPPIYLGTRIYGPIFGVIGAPDDLTKNIEDPSTSKSILVYCAGGNINAPPINGLAKVRINGYNYPYRLHSVNITKCSPVGGLPDNCGNLSGTAPPPTQAPVRPTIPPYNPANNIPWGQYPNNLNFQPPPSIQQPIQTNNQSPSTIVIPAFTPVSVNFPNSPPITFGPFVSPTTVTLPPFNPSNLNNPYPITFQPPAPAKPVVIVSPGVNPSTITISGYAPITIDPSGQTPPQGLTPNPDPTKTKSFTPTIPATPITSPTPTAPTAPLTPTIPTTPDPNYAFGLVAITTLLLNIAAQTAPNALQNAAAAGTCQTTQPGGCSSNLVNNAINNINANTNAGNAANAANNAAQTGMLATILSRIGAQLPGGLAGATTRLSTSLGIDRVMNLINFAANLHNALMLSNTLKVTLLEMLSSVGNATGLLQTSEGNNIDLNSVFNAGIDQFMILIMGQENYAGLKVTWRKYNRIYQAGANVINSMQSMLSSIGNVVETTAEYTGKIGNALMGAGAVAERAYQWFAEKQNAKISKFLQYSVAVGGTIAALEVINEISESVVEGQEAKDNAIKEVEKFQKELEDAEKNPGKENKAIAAEVAKQKANVLKDPTGEDEEGLLSFLTN